MVIGLHKVHMIPVPDYSDPSGRLIAPKARKASYGIVTLYSMNINSKGEDDRFELGFRYVHLRTVALDITRGFTIEVSPEDQC
jgi:hypothetical protein